MPADRGVDVTKPEYVIDLVYQNVLKIMSGLGRVIPRNQLRDNLNAGIGVPIPGGISLAIWIETDSTARQQGATRLRQRCATFPPLLNLIKRCHRFRYLGFIWQ
jgi:hypothetical protein